MKKKTTHLLLALSTSAILLGSCAVTAPEDTSTPPSSSSEAETLSSSESVSTESSSSSSSESSEPLPDPVVIEEGSLSYLKGAFYGNGGTLSLDEKALVMDGDSDLSLTPTKVGKIRLGSMIGMGAYWKDVLAVYFDASSNNGVSYCLYADVIGDGYVHLAEKNGNFYDTIATFQPDISKYAGAYSAFGDGSDSNTYEILDPEFDFDRDSYPLGRYYPAASMWTSEQGWHAKARIRLNSDDEICYTVDFCDSDDYSYGELEIKEGTSGPTLEDGFWTYYPDAGAFNYLSLFDEESKDNVSVSVNASEKTMVFGEKEGSYEIAFDDQGMYLDATFGEEKAKLRIADLHVTYEAENKFKVYPVDQVNELEGSFTDNVDIVTFGYDWDTWDYALKWNGEVKEFTYVVENNRKSISFVDGDVTYILSPDKESSSIRVSKDGVISYFINQDRYDGLFHDSFVAHDKDNGFVLSVNSDGSYTLGEEKGQVSYSYWHGDKSPFLILDDGNFVKALEIVQEDIGLFSLADNEGDPISLYSQTTLDQVYGTYSSDGKDTFVISNDSIIYKDASYTYEFAPSYQSGMGTYLFGISSSLGDFEANLAGCIYTPDMKLSLVKKDLFKKIAGTYSFYGKYGIENIKMTESGDLTLDSSNATGDGLERDVPYTYQIATIGSGDQIAYLAFRYGSLDVFIYFYEDYAMITGLNYYREEILSTWGVYLDEGGENILYSNGNSLYYNGDELTVNSKSSTGTGLVYETSAGTITFNVSEKAGAASIVTSDGTTSLTRKYAYADYAKFVGEYTANDTQVTFSAADNSYEVSIGSYAVSWDDMKFVLKDGKLAIQIPYGPAKYYLILDETTGTISCEYDAGTIPPAPPLPNS